MKGMRICGSCYNLVVAEDDMVLCPRCRKALEPSAVEVLEKFAENGTDPTRGGVKLSDAQRAAREVITQLREE